jgi:iron complex outermembrane recepter protein
MTAALTHTARAAALARLTRATALAAGLHACLAGRAGADPGDPATGDPAPATAAPATATAAPAGSPPATPAAGGEIIVVTGLRLPRPVADVPAAMLVLDRHELDRSPHALADDLVRTLPSAGTFRRGSSLAADPTSQGLNLRGVGPSAVSRALLLRDGVPANDPFGGWIYWRAISPLGVERIEAAPSGASALFGDFALGGVVHVVSRPIAARELRALVAAGSHDTRRAAIRASDRRGPLGIALEGEAFDTAGYAPIAPQDRGAVDGRAPSTHGTAGGRVEHARGGRAVHATARWFREALDAGTRHTTADVRTLTYGAGWRLARAAGTLQLELFGGAQELRQERARVAPDRGTAERASRQRTPSRHQGGLLTWTARELAGHTLVIGADGRRVTGTATDALSPARLDADTVIERAAGGEQRFAGIFAEDIWRISRALELAGALRLDAWQSRAGQRSLRLAGGDRMDVRFPVTSEIQLDPRLGVLARLSGELALRASVYRAFRAPTLNELYRPFQVGAVLTAANEALGSETLWGAEAGPQIVVGGAVVRATAFWNRLAGAIANVTLAEPLQGGATRRRANLGAARVAGLELDASFRPTAAWTASIAHTFVDADVIAAPAQPELVGKRLPQDPRHRTMAALAFEDPRVATLTAQVRYLGPQFEDDLNALPIGAVVLVDARAARRLPGGFELFASVQNLFDRRYLVGRAGIDTVGTPRTVEVGLAFDAGRR